MRVADQRDQDHDGDERPVEVAQLVGSDSSAGPIRVAAHGSGPSPARLAGAERGPRPARVELERLGHDVARDRRRPSSCRCRRARPPRRARSAARHRARRRRTAHGRAPPKACPRSCARRSARSLRDDAPDLRGAGLAGHGEPGSGRADTRARGAALAVHDLEHAAPDEVERPVGDPDRRRPGRPAPGRFSAAAPCAIERQHGAPAVARRAAITASCSGVACTKPWPMPTTRVSPWCQGAFSAARFQARSGTRPARSPGRSMPRRAPRPKRRAIAAIASMPTRRASS